MKVNFLYNRGEGGGGKCVLSTTFGVVPIFFSNFTHIAHNVVVNICSYEILHGEPF